MSGLCLVQVESCTGCVCPGYVHVRVMVMSGLCPCPSYVRVMSCPGCVCPGCALSGLCPARVVSFQGMCCPGCVLAPSAELEVKAQDCIFLEDINQKQKCKKEEWIYKFLIV